MADVHTKKVRSYNMSRIRSKNTRPEILVRKYLFSKGFRFRLHLKSLPGKPDIILPKYRTAIFVHGCFWHSHKGCKYFVLPKTKAAWWKAKLERNVLNDEKHREELERLNWRVIVVWECDLKPNLQSKTLESIVTKIIS